jgi:hypothetical protein
VLPQQAIAPRDAQTGESPAKAGLSAKVRGWGRKWTEARGQRALKANVPFWAQAQATSEIQKSWLSWSLSGQ